MFLLKTTDTNFTFILLTRLSKERGFCTFGKTIKKFCNSTSDVGIVVVQSKTKIIMYMQ